MEGSTEVFMSLLVKNVRIVDPTQKLDGVSSLLIVDGKVAAIGSEAEQGYSAEILDGAGKLLVPGRTRSP
jgi:dihydroorotase